MDSNRQKAVQKFAAIRLWTTEAVCYVVTSLMRDRNRSATSLAPILPYLKLLLSGLHRLPDTYLFEGTLFRAESNVRSNWDSTMQPGKTFGFFTLTSFSTDPEAIANFKSTSDSRTVFELIDGVGYKLESFSKYAGEAEVLVECVSIKEVVRSMKFDPKAAAGSGDLAGIVGKLTLMGEVPSGLHYVVARSRPGVALLAGSPAKAREKAVYDRAELEKLQPGPLPELVFDPSDDDPDADGADPAELSELGSGAFATTYRMRSADGAARYAVKTFKLRKMKGAGISPEDLEREVRILGALRHRHVIRYVGSRVTRSDFSIVMELAGGGSLAARIQAGAPPPAGELLRLARELAGGLEYVHGEGVVHRDVKPENILLSDAGAVKLVDFGLATVLTSSMGSCAPARAGGGGPGSPAYSSPEKAQGQSYGSKDDMWAAGCVLAELATGARLRGPVWSDGEEVRARRAELLLQAPPPPPAGCFPAARRGFSSRR